MKLFIIDGIGPFFRHARRRRINWSKICFDALESGGRPDPVKFRRIREDFRRFAGEAAAIGFNAVTLDDLAHLSEQPQYPESLHTKIRAYREEYAALFDIAASHGLMVLITTDVMFFPASGRPDRRLRRHVIPVLTRALQQVFADFPQVGGVILRAGECDGLDVRGDFRSRLVLRTPAQARRLIRALLPVCEQADRLLIFRTWTVGAYRIGDLIWNRNTFDRTFGGIESRHFVLSMKYGESDFFRYLPLNKLFFRSAHRKIVELQARREYEGFGEYPSFVGWDYEQYARQLATAPNLIGAWIWAQTGGWSVFRRLTFLDQSAVWNDINVCVTLGIVKDGLSTEQAVEEYARRRLGPVPWRKLLVLLRLSDEVVKELLYIGEAARHKLFFRRVRVPPLLSVFWDRIVVNHSLRKLLRCLVEDPAEAVVQGQTALAKIRTMQRLAAELGLPGDDLAFEYDTFEILAAARDYYFGPFHSGVVTRLESLKRRYQERYRLRYAVKLDFRPFHMPRSRLRHLLWLCVRRQRGYRLVDRLLMIRALSLLSPLLLLARHKPNRDLFRNQAMGIGAVLK